MRVNGTFLRWTGLRARRAGRRQAVRGTADRRRPDLPRDALRTAAADAGHASARSRSTSSAPTARGCRRWSTPRCSRRAGAPRVDPNDGVRRHRPQALRARAARRPGPRARGAGARSSGCSGSPPSSRRRRSRARSPPPWRANWSAASAPAAPASRSGSAASCACSPSTVSCRRRVRRATGVRSRRGAARPAPARGSSRRRRRGWRAGGWRSAARELRRARSAPSCAPAPSRRPSRSSARCARRAAARGRRTRSRRRCSRRRCRSTRASTLGTAYRPGMADLEVGGDWYDAFTLPGDRVAIGVGDVVGRGIAAASTMGQLRSAVRALAGTGMSPGAVLDHLDTFVDQVVPARYATLAYADVEPATGGCAARSPGTRRRWSSRRTTRRPSSPAGGRRRSASRCGAWSARRAAFALEPRCGLPPLHRRADRAPRGVDRRRAGATRRRGRGAGGRGP